ncbi:biotin-dependent carboxyltransferase family protein [Angustibacter peucedani]
MSLEVLATGPLTTVQDLGRPGLADLGVGPSGAADRSSLRQVNRLLGNAEGAAALEVALGGLRLRATTPVHLATAGAPCGVRVLPGGREGEPRDVGPGTPFHLQPADVVELAPAPRGLRCYLGVRGGLDVEPVLGSRSTDLLAGLGPAPLGSGDELPVGSDVGPWPGVDEVVWLTDPAAREPLRAKAGPRDDWFGPAALDALAAGPWVAADADRTAVVLDGPTLRRTRTDELPTEGVVRGAVQVPPSGRPTVLLADHPVTGGYPVVAVLLAADVDRLAQCRPGDAVRLRLLPGERW